MLLREFSADSGRLDRILEKCCRLVLDKHQVDPDYWGMVGACVLDGSGRAVYGVNHRVDGDLRDHAEVVAIKRYIRTYGSSELGDCTVITTLSPCSTDTDQPGGRTCTEYLDKHGIKKVYCGYIDPGAVSTETYAGRDWSLTQTKNGKLKSLCKKLAGTFL